MTNNHPPPAPVPWHRTKIVCTLGPATDRPGVLEALVRAGMDVARVNTSHGNHAEHRRRIRLVRRVARRLGQHVAVLADLPGPKFRLGDLPDGTRELRPGDRVTLAAGGAGPDRLPVRDREILAALRPGEAVYLADGLVRLTVEGAAPERVACRVVAGGVVRSGSGINLPDAKFVSLVPTAEDRRQIAFALGEEVDWLGVSFVQSPEDIARVRACFTGAPGLPPLVLAKIEKRQALVKLEAITAAADGVMVARGDLGVETDPAEMPLVQKRIINVANRLARPVVTATQMLESMVAGERPTRAEVTDVANAVLDGTDAVMLSAETSIGLFPAAAAQMMQRVLAATEREYGVQMARARLREESGATGEPLVSAACRLADRLGARALIAFVGELSPGLEVARFRPAAPFLALADSEVLCRRLAPVWGACALRVPRGAGLAAGLARARTWLFAHGLARAGDPAVLLLAPRSGGGADALRVIRL